MDDKLFRALVENSFDAIFLADAQGRVTYASAAIARVLGYSIDDVIGTSGFDLVHPDDLPAAQKVFTETIENPARHVPFALRVRRKDASYVNVEGVCQSRLEDPAVRAVVINYRDVSDRKRAEAALGASEALRSAMLGSALDAVIAIDHRSRILEFSVSAERIFGRQRDAVIGQSLAEVVIPPSLREQHRQGMARYLATGVESVLGRRVELPALHSSGAEFPVEISITRIPDAEPPKFVAYIRDLTQQKQAEAEQRTFEAQVLHAQKLESLGLLAGGIAHDFNNILTGILGFASLARMDLPPESPILPLLEEIEQGGHRAADLAQQMLAYSGRGRFVIQTFALDASVREMHQFLATAISKKAKLSLELEPAPVDGDASQLRQVLMNLVINASDALDNVDGSIVVRTGTRLCTRDALRSPYIPENLPAGRYCFIEVRDSGSGMTEETLRRLFDPFFTTKGSGRGLGLASVLGIVRGHRGTVRVSSCPGQGTSFEVLIPAATAPVPESAPPVFVRAPGARNSGTILVVDDEDSVRSLVRSVLERAGFDVRVASDGSEAVEAFLRDGAGISGVLLDLTMPRMDGLEAAQKLKSIRAEVPILLMSGYNEQDISRQFSELGVSGFIKKPFSPDALVSAVSHILTPVD